MFDRVRYINLEYRTDKSLVASKSKQISRNHFTFFAYNELDSFTISLCCSDCVAQHNWRSVRIQMQASDHLQDQESARSRALPGHQEGRGYQRGQSSCESAGQSASASPHSNQEAKPTKKEEVRRRRGIRWLRWRTWWLWGILNNIDSVTLM